MKLQRAYNLALATNRNGLAPTPWPHRADELECPLHGQGTAGQQKHSVEDAGAPNASFWIEEGPAASAGRVLLSGVGADEQLGG